MLHVENMQLSTRKWPKQTNIIKDSLRKKIGLTAVQLPFQVCPLSKHQLNKNRNQHTHTHTTTTKEDRKKEKKETHTHTQPTNISRQIRTRMASLLACLQGNLRHQSPPSLQHTQQQQQKTEKGETKEKEKSTQPTTNSFNRG